MPLYSRMSTIYDRQLLQEDRQRTVVGITVTTSGSTSTVSGEPAIFHWHLYLVLGPSTAPTAEVPGVISQSVLIDMIPVNPPTGCMVITSKRQPCSESNVKAELEIATTGSPTVQQIIDLFKSKGMDRYNFDDTGSGCLWWLWTGLEYLEQAHLVETSATEKLRRFHSEQVTLHPERHPIPMRQGTFY